MNVLARSSFIQTVHHGKRNDEETQQFVEKIKENSNGKAPTFLSDGFESYPKAILQAYSDFNEKTQKFEVDEALKYAQIIKHKKGGKLESIEERSIHGSREEIIKVIEEEGRGKTINTSFVESRNGNYRKDNKRLARKSQCHSKKVEPHDAQIDFLTAVYNFCRPNENFRQCCNKEAKRFEIKYEKRSPAVVEEMTENVLTLEDLLMMRTH